MPTFWPIAGNPAVTIGGNDPAFHARVRRSLDKINQTAAGAALLAGLTARRTAVGHDVVIAQGHHNLCRVHGLSDQTRTLLAQAILDGNGSVSVAINNALVQINPPGNQAQWLANAMNATPVYNLAGPVSVTLLPRVVTALHVTQWLADALPFPAPFPAAQHDALTNVLLTVLWQGARFHGGPGRPAEVRWNQHSHSLLLTTGNTISRSKTIGLAHELVHAYYNVFGLQMGLDNGHATTAICEYMCVGLGHWSVEPISENAVRSAWHTVVKNTLFGGRINVHYGATVARPNY